MKFFVDSAVPAEVDTVLRCGVARGVTTNPSHLAEAAFESRMENLHALIRVIRHRVLSVPLSVQIMTMDPAEMLEEARMLRDTLQYDHLVIKIPVGLQTLEIIHELTCNQFVVNGTACMTQVQALLGAEAGARYVSLFWGKMGDVGLDAFREVQNLVQSLHQNESETEIIIGSIRKAYDVMEIARTGADIVTLRPTWFATLAAHPQTDAAVQNFAADFTSWGETRERVRT